MKTVLLWFLAAAALSGLLWKFHRKPGSPEHPEEQPQDKQPPEEKKHEDRPPEKPSEEQLLEQLRCQREKTALLQYREECGRLFMGLSRGIQTMLALASRTDMKERSFCRRVSICVENEGIAYQIVRRELPCAPQPISPEEEAADAEALQKLIRREQRQHFVPAVVIDWDRLMEELLPCLEDILRLAEEFQAEACRNQLEKLEKILAGYDIHPIWYRDNRVQQNADMQWDYVETEADPMPALYHCREGKYTRVGSPGYTGP